MVTAVPSGAGEFPVTAGTLEGLERGDVVKIREGIEIDGERLAEICRGYGIVRLEVFGSVLRDDFTDDSDIDVLYEVAPDASLGWEIVDLKAELSELFGRRVDLVGRRSVHWYIRDQVLAEAKQLHAA